jgi:protein TonB
MIKFAAEDLIDLRRWAISAVAVLAVHGAIAAAVGWVPAGNDEQVFPFDFQNVGELAAPVEVLNDDRQPGPEQVVAEASESKPSESLEEKPQEKAETKPVEEVPEVPPTPNPEIPVEQLKEVKEETPRRQEAQPFVPMTTAPVTVPDRVASIAQSQVPRWKSQISGLIERQKRYPPTAEARRVQGVVQVVFSLDRKGHVIESHIAASSGSSVLDEEAMAMLRRAQPFPPPPAELTSEHFAFTVPVRFNLR